MQSVLSLSSQNAIVRRCSLQDAARRRRFSAQIDGDEKSQRGALRITYQRARGLFKCKHNVVPGRIVPLSVILQFNLRSRGASSTRRGTARYGAVPGRDDRSARSFVHCNIVKSPSFHHEYISYPSASSLSPFFPSTPGIHLCAHPSFRCFISLWRTRH